jgi:uroporphyrinogen decarboxylase
MRQAGRYLPEYRKVREKHTLLEICADPELAKEVTLQPIRRFDLDAAIIFADILLPLKCFGVEFDFVAGEGPRIFHPVRGAQDLERLGVGNPKQDLSFVFEAIRLVRDALDSKVALIGFAGAPFTVASYVIEGSYSRNFLQTKLLMYKHPEVWKALMEIISEVTLRYLKAQIEAGAQAIQLFDSWVGCLQPDDYLNYVLPYSRGIFESLKQYNIPLIHFGTGTATFLELMQEAGGTVMSVDWRLDLDQVWKRLGDNVAVQGNLDPVALFGDSIELEKKVDMILDQAQGRPGHIFNLGHGFLPQTPIESVEKIVQWVHQKSKN